MYKVDSRLGIKINRQFLDIAHVGVETTKVKDSHQVVSEANTIIRKIVSSSYFINAASFTVFRFKYAVLKVTSYVLYLLNLPNTPLNEHVSES